MLAPLFYGFLEFDALAGLGHVAQAGLHAGEVRQPLGASFG